MNRRTRRGLAAAAICSAGLLVAGAPLVATATKGGHHPDTPGKRNHRPIYGDPGARPGLEPVFPSGKVRSATRFAKLLGHKEIDAKGGRGAGDPDGQGGATITITPANKLCFAIVVQGIGTPVAANIYAGRRWQNGKTVVVLTPPATGDPGASAGCIENVDSRLLYYLRKKPHQFYVNVHTADYPDGALRGQLRRF